MSFREIAGDAAFEGRLYGPVFERQMSSGLPVDVSPRELDFTGARAPQHFELAAESRAEKGFLVDNRDDFGCWAVCTRILSSYKDAQFECLAGRHSRLQADIYFRDP